MKEREEKRREVDDDEEEEEKKKRVLTTTRRKRRGEGKKCRPTMRCTRARTHIRPVRQQIILQ